MSQSIRIRSFSTITKEEKLFVKHLGEEVAAGILEHEEALLAKGIEYCDCPGCTAGKRVMDNKALFLA